MSLDVYKNDSLRPPDAFRSNNHDSLISRSSMWSQSSYAKSMLEDFPRPPEGNIPVPPLPDLKANPLLVLKPLSSTPQVSPLPPAVPPKSTKPLVVSATPRDVRQARRRSKSVGALPSISELESARYAAKDGFLPPVPAFKKSPVEWELTNRTMKRSIKPSLYTTSQRGLAPQTGSLRSQRRPQQMQEYIATRRPSAPAPAPMMAYPAKTTSPTVRPPMLSIKGGRRLRVESTKDHQRSRKDSEATLKSQDRSWYSTSSRANKSSLDIRIVPLNYQEVESTEESPIEAYFNVHKQYIKESGPLTPEERIQARLASVRNTKNGKSKDARGLKRVNSEPILNKRKPTHGSGHQTMSAKVAGWFKGVIGFGRKKDIAKPGMVTAFANTSTREQIYEFYKCSDGRF